ncbi:hypothetical protein F4780DRAFT_777823 [Xylariomycetidae sp. FL0641]|nr:hypothetical protein F4780DRAFT_777823 [Xylariomycetidae sp. FL0641]
MDTVDAYAFSTLAWHAAQAVPLLVWPQAINGLLTMDADASVPAAPTPVENYFARCLGLALLALGAVTVVLTGAIPLGGVEEENDASPTANLPPYAAPVVLLTTLHHSAGGILTWTRYAGTGEAGFLMGLAGNGFLAAFGIYCLLFAGEKAKLRKSKRRHLRPFSTKKAEEAWRRERKDD